MTTAIAYERGTPATRIFKLRQKAELTQLQLSQKVGMSRPLVSMWEKGDCTPKLDEFRALAGALNTTPEFLAFGRVG